MSHRIAALAFAAGLALAHQAFAADAPLPLTGKLSQAASGPYDLDAAHTSIVFSVGHIGLSAYTARFDRKSGVIGFDKAKPENSTLEVKIDATSLSTGDGAFDEQLKGKDFLNAVEFPEMRYVSRKVVRTGPRTGRVIGDLTFRGVTKPVTLDVVWNGVIEHPVEKRSYMGFSASGVLKRSEFGFIMGIPFVADQVRFTIQTEALRRP